MSNNPYSQAASAYGSVDTVADQRVLEATILQKSAQKLEVLGKRLLAGEKIPLEEIGDILDYNQKIWQVFVDNMQDPTCALPLEIRNNIASLAVFIFKQTHAFMIDHAPEKLDGMVNINRQIAAGLMKSVANCPAKAAAPSAPPSEGMTGTNDMA